MNNKDTGYFNFYAVVTMTFICAKLIGAVTWSWWLVLSPIWFSIALPIGIMFIICIYAVILALYKTLKGDV